MLIIAGAELQRLLATRRGLVTLIGFALLWAALLNYVILPAASLFAGAQASGLVELLWPRLGLSEAELWAPPELIIYWAISLYLLPLLALVISADQTASDRSRGTLRYLVLRCSRLEILLGRFLGQVCIMALAILLMFASVLLISLSQSAEALQQALPRLPMLLLLLNLLVWPYIALMSWVSIMARSARQATLLAMMIWIAASFLVGYLQLRFGPGSLLDWVMPGSQIRDWLHVGVGVTWLQTGVPLIQSVVLLALAALLITRRDL